MKNYKFKISCIMPIYNVEEYLEESIESIVAQTIGFKENVQLILIDDGSTDRSGEICDKYKLSYSDNVIVFHKQNGGVSSAKNLGLEHAQGEFVTFVDPDDLITKNVMKRVYEYFTQVKSETSLVAIPIYCFEGVKGPYPLNRKFTKQNEVVELRKKPDSIILGTVAVFYISEEIVKHRFDENLQVSEDLLFNYEYLLEKPTMGLVPSVKYLYRKRNTENSLIQLRWSNASSYNSYLKDVQKKIIDIYIGKQGEIPNYLQSVLMYDLQPFIKRRKLINEILSNEEEKEFYTNMFGILEYIEPKVITSQIKLSIDEKKWLLAEKFDWKGNEGEKQIDILLQSVKITKLPNLKIKVKRLIRRIYHRTLYDFVVRMD